MKVLLQPVFLLCVALFTLHQVMQFILNIQLQVLNNYLDNFLAMPILLTLLLAERRWLFKKGSSYHLTIFEGVVATAYIIFIGEWLFPLLSGRFTSDWIDALYYIGGTICFYLFINLKRHPGDITTIMP